MTTYLSLCSNHSMTTCFCYDSGSSSTFPILVQPLRANLQKWRFSLSFHPFIADPCASVGPNTPPQPPEPHFMKQTHPKPPSSPPKTNFMIHTHPDPPKNPLFSRSTSAPVRMSAQNGLVTAYHVMTSSQTAPPPPKSP